MDGIDAVLLGAAGAAKMDVDMVSGTGLTKEALEMSMAAE